MRTSEGQHMLVAIEVKTREARLRLFGHVQWSDSVRMLVEGRRVWNCRQRMLIDCRDPQGDCLYRFSQTKDPEEQMINDSCS